MLRPNAKRAQDDNTRKSSNFEVNMSEQEILLIEPIDCTEEIKVNKLSNNESSPSQASEKFLHFEQCSFTNKTLKGIL